MPWVNPAADVHEVEFNVTPFTFDGQAGTETRYWIGIQMSNNIFSGSNFFEMREDPVNPSNVLVGEPFVQFDANTATWGYVDFGNGNGPEDEAEGFYTLNGDCDVLSTESFDLSSVTVYPNPASDAINLKVPSGIDVLSVEVYDVLGKTVKMVIDTKAVNVSDLSPGIYVLHARTSAGVLTRKIMKK